MTSQNMRIEKDAAGIVHIEGSIDEYSDFGDLLREQEPLRLNLKNVAHMNSIGIRNFLKFLSDWGSKRLEYHECPADLIEQFNMIPPLLGSQTQAVVQSFEIPYECTSCDQTLLEWIKTSSLPKVEFFEDWVGPIKACPKCGQEMIVSFEHYFTFLSMVTVP